MSKNKQIIPQDKVSDAWLAVVAELEMGVSKPLFETYIRRLEVVGDADGVVVKCASAFQETEIKRRWMETIEKRLKKELGDEVGVRLEVGVGKAKVLDFDESSLFAYTAPEIESLEMLLEKFGLKADLSLDNFAVSGSNEMAYAAAKAVASNPGNAYNPLFLYGGVGVGKTHLMQGVGQEILRQKRKMKLGYCSGEEFTNEIIEAIQTKSTMAFRKRYRNVGVLLIDDIQFIAGKAAVQEEFFHTFNAIVNAQGQVILTSDKPPRDIDRLEERLRSRFEGGLSIDIGQPDFELRSAILMIKSKQMGVALPVEVAQEIARDESNIRSLLGKLMKVMAVANTRRVPLSVELASGVLEQERKGEEMGLGTVKPDQVVEVVAAYYASSVADVVGKSRVKYLTKPRHVAMYLLKTDLQMGLVEIGNRFGGRDHTSVMHAVSKIKGMVRDDHHTREELREIKERLVKN